MTKDKDIFENIKSILKYSGTINNWVLDSLRTINTKNVPQDRRSVYSRKSIVSWMVLSKLLTFQRALLHE